MKSEENILKPDKPVYSFHTFILPFIWNIPQNKKLCLSKMINANFDWNRVEMPVLSYDLPVGKDTETVFSQYKEQIYFHPFVRDSIYLQENEAVEVYDYNMEDTGTYTIKAQDATWILELNRIRLKIYPTGVALLLFECANREYRSLDDVKNINDLGRRLFPVFINKDVRIWADMLIVSTSSGEFKINNRNSINTYFEGKKLDKLFKPSIGDIAIGLFTDGLVCTEKLSRQYREYAEQLVPVFADRMYVASYVIDKEKFTQLFADKEKNYANDESLSKDLYEFVFVDRPDDCSCLDASMREALIEERLYKRWIDYRYGGAVSGSVICVDSMSMLVITASTAEFLYETFLTQYIQMISISLVQMASALFFKREIAGITMEVANKKHINWEIRRKIIALQSEVTTFENRFCFHSITPEIQGTELYEMIKKFSNIDAEKESLKAQMQGLYEISSSNSSLNFEFIGLFLAVVATVAQLGSLGVGEIRSGIIFILVLGLSCVAALILFLLRNIHD